MAFEYYILVLNEKIAGYLFSTNNLRLNVTILGIWEHHCSGGHFDL